MRFRVICIRMVMVAAGILVVPVYRVCGYIVQPVPGVVMAHHHAQSRRDRCGPLKGDR